MLVHNKCVQRVFLLLVFLVSPAMAIGQDAGVSFVVPERLCGLQLVGVEEKSANEVMGFSKDAPFKCREYTFLTRDLQRVYIRVCNVFREDLVGRLRPGHTWGRPLRIPYTVTPGGPSIDGFLESIGAYYRTIEAGVRPREPWCTDWHQGCADVRFGVGKYLVAIETPGAAEPGHDSLWLPIVIVTELCCVNDGSSQCDQPITIHIYGEPYVIRVPLFLKPKGGEESSTTPTPSTRTLTVTKTGTGNGTVTSNPAGIDCASDCTETYARGTRVTLTATPYANSVFTGWSGDCAGSNYSTTVTMDSNKTCVATFSLTEPVPDIAIVSRSLEPTNPELNDNATVRIEIANVGADRAPPAKYLFALELLDVKGKGLDAIGTSIHDDEEQRYHVLTGYATQLPELVPGASAEVTIQFRVDPDLVPSILCTDRIDVKVLTHNYREDRTNNTITYSTVDGQIFLIDPETYCQCLLLAAFWALTTMPEILELSPQQYAAALLTYDVMELATSVASMVRDLNAERDEDAGVAFGTACLVVCQHLLEEGLLKTLTGFVRIAKTVVEGAFACARVAEVPLAIFIKHTISFVKAFYSIAGVRQ